ncbi:type I polyketide synthase [Streptomyces sp. JB150]|uniref:type I polyketide synthase n=1 Tax=Streptomyces sp. JB150 TaxID=2714844 RepID=UPI00140C8736|nr:type I polyketide synthase [Streptomyces sp. JB150]QIJ65458.1 type I polyketide synthase [Streptomyces sp. JB150]
MPHGDLTPAGPRAAGAGPAETGSEAGARDAGSAGPVPEDLLFALSARTPAALRENAARLARWLTDAGADTPLADVAHTLALRRAHLTERVVLRAGDRATLVRLLHAVADGRETGPRSVRGSVPDTRPTEPVFVFSGHGSQWDGMGAGLLAEEPLFAAVVEALEPVVREETGAGLRTLLTGGGLAGAGMDRVQPAVYAMHIGLAEVWRGRGILPGAVLGHSMGEIAAAVVAGALSPEDGARVVCRRSRLMQLRLGGTGATALVELDAAEARRRLDGRDGISVAVHSSPRACVVAGLPETVERFVEECRDEGRLARLVPGVSIGAHSPLVDPLLGELRAALADIAPGSPNLPYYSTTLDDPRERPRLDGAYWTANLRRPVRLSEAVRAAAQDGRRVFLEVSPHPVVAQSVLETVLDADGLRTDRSTVLGTLARDTPSRTALAGTLAALHCAGVPLPRPSVPAGRHADLPTYAWQHQRFPRPRSTPVDAAPAHPLLGHRVTLPGTPVRHVWQSRVGLDRLPWLGDHRVHGTPVLPGTAHAELALAAACEAFGTAPAAVHVRDLCFDRLLPLIEPATLTTTLEEEPDASGGRITVTSGTGGAATILATAHVEVGEPGPLPGPAGHGTSGARPAQADHQTGGVRRDPHDLYTALRGLGQEHGPAFAAVRELRVSAETVSSRVTRPAALPPDARFRFHPALLDACLHGVGALLPAGTHGTYLPTAVKRLRWSAAPVGDLVCRAGLNRGSQDGELTADVEVRDENGTLVAQLTGIRLSPVGDQALPADVTPLLHRVRWEEMPAPEPPHGTGQRVLLLGAGPADPNCAAVGAALSAAGASCEFVVRGRPWDARRRVDGVVLAAWGGQVEPADVAEAAERRVRCVLRLVADLLRAHDAAGTPPPPLTVLTVRARRVRRDETPDPVQAALRGLVRTLRQERPELTARLVDMDDGEVPPAAELLAADGPDEVAWRSGRRHVARLAAEAPEPPERPHVVVRPGGGYLVSGGTRGLGLATARWLAEHGAGTVVLGGRGPLGPDAAEDVARIQALGTRVELVTGDVARPGTAERMVAAVTATGARLRGVVHTAAVLEDALVTEAEPGRLHRVWAPKAGGAWRLHEATSGLGLDWWIGYSSFASLAGSPGQAEYAAANAFLDSVVALRRAAGLPALAVNWGPWGDIGAVRGRAVPGVGAIDAREGFAALEALIARNAEHGGVARLVPREFAAAYPQIRASSFFATLLGTTEEADGFDRAALDGMTAEARRDAVRARTLLSVGRVLGFDDPGRIAERPLVHLGLDSLAAVRIKNALRDDFAVDIPVARLLQGASAAELADQVTRALGDDGAASARPAASAVRDAARRAAARTARTAARPRRRETRERNA